MRQISRPLRVEFEYALYHLTTRGNVRKRTFPDDDDPQWIRCCAGSGPEVSRSRLHSVSAASTPTLGASRSGSISEGSGTRRRSKARRRLEAASAKDRALRERTEELEEVLPKSEAKRRAPPPREERVTAVWLPHSGAGRSSRLPRAAAFRPPSPLTRPDRSTGFSTG